MFPTFRDVFECYVLILGVLPVASLRKSMRKGRREGMLDCKGRRHARSEERGERASRA